ncbi:MAG: hypothetical protein WDN04_19040 [Rhodospirillales bacterium]
MIVARPKRPARALRVGFLLIGAAVVPAQAADAPPALEQVVVTARHPRGKSADRADRGVHDHDRRQEIATSGITAVSQLQKLVPTLQITQFNPRNTSFNIRGLGKTTPPSPSTASKAASASMWMEFSIRAPHRRRSRFPISTTSSFARARKAPCSARTPPPARLTCTLSGRVSRRARISSLGR